MLANQIASFRRTLTPNKSNQKENSFFVITKPEPSEFSKAVSLLNESKEESFVVALAFQSERAQWESTAEKWGLSLNDSLSVPELEFAKDEAGRQVVDLDDPKYEYQIYERLVREGMNPVLAHPEASEAIRRLRRMTEVQILFFSAKNVQKSAKNPWFVLIYGLSYLSYLILGNKEIDCCGQSDPEGQKTIFYGNKTNQS